MQPLEKNISFVHLDIHLTVQHYIENKTNVDVQYNICYTTTSKVNKLLFIKICQYTNQQVEHLNIHTKQL